MSAANKDKSMENKAACKALNEKMYEKFLLMLLQWFISVWSFTDVISFVSKIASQFLSVTELLVFGVCVFFGIGT